jgi:uncharacterized protein YebE (UPF0316 family)
MTLDLLLAAAAIFLLRITDVSLGTIRIVMLVRGRRRIAGVLSFCESFIWLLAAAQVLSNLDSVWKMVAYAGGYAAGTMLGSTIERWIAVGDSLLRVVVRADAPPLASVLRDQGFYATAVEGEGRDGEVRIVFSVVPRRRLPQALKLVRERVPEAFVTFEDVRTAAVTPLPAARVRK